MLGGKDLHEYIAEPINFGTGPEHFGIALSSSFSIDGWRKPRVASTLASSDLCASTAIS